MWFHIYETASFKQKLHTTHKLFFILRYFYKITDIVKPPKTSQVFSFTNFHELNVYLSKWVKLCYAQCEHRFPWGEVEKISKKEGGGNLRWGGLLFLFLDPLF